MKRASQKSLSEENLCAILGWLSNMNYLPTRRRFMKTAAAATAALSVGDLSFLSGLPRVSAAEANLKPAAVRFDDDIEPLVRLVEETPRDRLLEEIGSRVRRGLAYREVLAALLLAGVRNIQPRPVGFKFHAVLVVNSAHLASLSSPDTDRWLPIFWALDNFKQSQAQDAREGDWTLGAPEESKVPPSHKAKQAFIDAMDNWDEAAADAAIAGLARTTGAQQLFEIFCRYGARDFRDIGHKAIYVANSWRTLQVIGWQHAEPVLRSLAYALLERGRETNPAKADLAPDRPGRRNAKLLAKIRPDWQGGKLDSSATAEILETLRRASADEACDKVVEFLNRGVAPQSVWDALFDAAGEMLMRRPGIVSLHAVTTSNALHFAYENTASDETRRLLVLQNAAFLTLFRGDADKLPPGRIDELRPANGTGDAAPDLEEIFSEISRDRTSAARKTLAWLRTNREAKPFIDGARRLVFLKGDNSHDYKFSSAVLEDYSHLSPQWRERYLAASVFQLRGSGAPDNALVKRIRAALA